MKLEMTKQNGETARHVSSGKRGLWLKEMVRLKRRILRAWCAVIICNVAGLSANAILQGV